MAVMEVMLVASSSSTVKRRNDKSNMDSRNRINIMFALY